MLNFKVFTILALFFSGLFQFSFFAKPYSNIKPPDWSHNKTIYEVNLRQFSPGGSIKEFKEHLPRLKEMGVGVLWFMPIHPVGAENRKGTLGSYYSVQDYKGVDPAYGTKEEFRELVEEIHSMGMYIILDWVANHTAWDNPWAKSNPEFYVKDKEGKFTPPRGTDWSDVIQLDYSNKEMRLAMTDALEYWVREFDVDGYRCDVAAMVPTDFWESVYKKLSAIKPVFMLAEAHEVALHKNAFHMSYAWDTFNLMKDMAKGKEKPEDFLKKVKKQDSPYPPQGIRMRFTSNHDENSWNGTEFELFGDAALAYSVLAATLPGMHLIYTGQEAGNKKRLAFFEKDPVDWSDLSRADFFKKLNTLKRDNSALHHSVKSGSMEPIKHSNGKLITYLRRNGSDAVLVVVNVTSSPQTTVIKSVKGLPEMTDIFSGAKIALAKEASVTLQPGEHRVYAFSKADKK
ncbi:MAG: Alpha-amylase 2 [Ignavibacteriaceae bacterium]|nr:Alpha-amylase 2 [Ignavibacteriaceae bacterium]